MYKQIPYLVCTIVYVVINANRLLLFWFLLFTSEMLLLNI